MPVPPPAVASSLLRLLPAAIAATGFALLAQAGRTGTWPAPLPALREPLSNLLLSLAALAAALLLVQALGWLVWDRLVPRYSGLRLPQLLRQFVAVLVMAMAFVGVLAQVWDVALSAVLATTGVIGLVLGLALRRILTDFFSGIALNVEQPFRLDDFILLHTRQRREPIAGLVREITWRSTRILTPEDNLVSVPNSVVASAVVENLSYPSPVSEQEIDLVLDWALPQGMAEALLGAAVTEAWAQGAAAGDKPPKVRICRLDGRGVTWRITYLLDPRRKAKGPARHELLASVHRHLVLAGLRPVHDNTPERPPAWTAGTETPPVPATGTAAQFDTREARRRVFDTLTLLDSLAVEEREALVAAMRLRALARGDTVVERGLEGRSMFVIAAGVVEVRVPDAAGQSQQVAVMGAGASFGEMSLLTGEARSADVVAMTPLVLFEIDAEALQPLLLARPLLADALSRTVAEHQQADDRLRHATQPTVTPAPGRAAAIAARIRTLFRLS